MRFPWLDAIVLVIILVGGVFFVRSASNRARLQAELKALERTTGTLEITDPSQVYLRGMKTELPLEFAWRGYFPPGYMQVVRDKSGSGSRGSTSDASHFICRVRVREKDDSAQIYYSFNFSSSLRGVDPQLAKFLHGRWHRLRVEQFARDQQESLDPQTGSAVLLRLSLPDDMLEEAKVRLSAHQLKDALVPFEVQLGPPTAQP